jgi:hypothetical protein
MLTTMALGIVKVVWDNANSFPTDVERLDASDAGGVEVLAFATKSSESPDDSLHEEDKMIAANKKVDNTMFVVRLPSQQE